jgi:hypothetical protein
MEHPVKTSIILVILVSVFGAACGASSAPELASVQTSLLTAGTDAGSTQPGYSGYQHVVARSRLALGAGVKTYTAAGYDKVEGADGIFATNPLNGAAFGMSHPAAPSLQVAQVGTDTDHNQQVRDYFTNAGIPTSQIAGVHATYAGSASGTGTGAPKVSSLVIFSSHLTRVVDGIDVVDSLAWARMNQQGTVTRETVFWPPVPTSVVDQARAMKAVLVANGPEMDKIRAAMPQKLQAPIRLVIRHSSAFIDDSPRFFAVYEALEDAPGATWQHYDQNGKEMHLPQELRSAPATPK